MSIKRSGTDDNKLLGQPFQYSELVHYQEGSIVSRTIINKKTGTITVFAFDKGQKLSEHTAPFDALVEVIDGSASIIIEGIEHPVTAGQQIIMPADKPHAVNADQRFKMVLVMIRN
jgi:quercetin dioxygenase-like cupin family protein